MADAELPSNPTSSVKQLASIVAGSVLFANLAFFFLSERYFADRVAKHGAGELAHLPGTRLHFAIFTAVVGIGLIGAIARPLWVGHGLATLGGAVALVGGVAALQTDIPSVLGASLLIIGVIIPVVAWSSYRGGSRAAWAFLVSLAGTLGLITMFGAPTLGRLLGTGMWTAMILPGVLAVATTALLALSERYPEI